MSSQLVEDEIEVTSGASSRPRRWKRFLAATVVGSISLLGVDVAPASAGPVCVIAEENAAESRFVSQLNAMRQSKGLSTLVANSAIASPSRSWSATMSGQNWLHHARDTGAGDGVEPHQDYVYQVGRAVPDWSRVAENVGVSGLHDCANINAAVDALHRAFVNSPGHYQNMIGDFNQVGIGVYVDPDQLWVTVRFAKGTAPKPEPTYTNAQLSDAAEFITAAYDVFLGRAASSSEVSFWSKTVAGGDRAALTRALSVSNEWAGTRVNALYETVLGRPAEASGQKGWVDAIARGMKLESVAAAIYGSQERFNLSGGTHRGYVEGLYADILGRGADAGGLGHWVGLLDRRSMTRSQVAAGFYGSLESRRDRITTLYAEILGRKPDAQGMTHWTSKITSLGDVALAATLATSREFWIRSTS